MTNKEYIKTQLDDIIKALTNIRDSIMESEETDTVKTKSTYGQVPVGETFEFRGKEYIVKEVGRIECDCIAKHNIGSICDICAFDKGGSSICKQLDCTSFERRDETDVYFVEKK